MLSTSNHDIWRRSLRTSASRSMLSAFLAAFTLALLLAPSASAAQPTPSVRPAHRPSCAEAVTAGFARCHARQRTDRGASPHAGNGPSGGYAPADLRAAYNIPASSPGELVAIVDAYDDPHAESDLATYRSQFGLPPCTTANGCFLKVDQNGGSIYPAINSGWAQEISLDLDVVSAVCPNCHILLVEARSNSFSNLGTAINRAVAMGAKVVSNSYGGFEWSR